MVTEGSKFPFNCSKGLVVVLNREFLIRSLGYFYLKASNEVKKYCNKKQYAKISEEKLGILYYSGRILPSQQFTNKLDLSDVCIDLSTSTFCVPLVDKYSPLAYAIINEIHWYHDDAHHSGDDTVFRYVQQIAHILDGRSLVTSRLDMIALVADSYENERLMLQWDQNQIIIFALLHPFT